MGSPCEEVLLNKLLHEMDGLRADAEILFILTTTRPEALEAALASRPGRVDHPPMKPNLIGPPVVSLRGWSCTQLPSSTSAYRLADLPRDRGGVPCDRISTARPTFEVMSKRRRGYPERDPCQAGPPTRPRQQGASREARSQRPLSLRQRTSVQAVLSQFGLLSTARIVTITSDRGRNDVRRPNKCGGRHHDRGRRGDPRFRS